MSPYCSWKFWSDQKCLRKFLRQAKWLVVTFLVVIVFCRTLCNFTVICYYSEIELSGILLRVFVLHRHVQWNSLFLLVFVAFILCCYYLYGSQITRIISCQEIHPKRKVLKFVREDFKQFFELHDLLTHPLQVLVMFCTQVSVCSVQMKASSITRNIVFFAKCHRKTDKGNIPLPQCR